MTCLGNLVRKMLILGDVKSHGEGGGGSMYERQWNLKERAREFCRLKRRLLDLSLGEGLKTL